MQGADWRTDLTLAPEYGSSIQQALMMSKISKSPHDGCATKLRTKSTTISNMKMNQASNIHFIHVHLPDPHASTPQMRSGMRSHAARAAHAKARRLRSVQFQSDMQTALSQSHQHASSMGNKEHKQDALGIVTHWKDVAGQEPDLVDLLTTSRRDPFASLALKFNRFEHFMFDYCKLMHSRNP